RRSYEDHFVGCVHFPGERGGEIRIAGLCADQQWKKTDQKSETSFHVQKTHVPSRSVSGVPKNTPFITPEPQETHRFPARTFLFPIKDTHPFNDRILLFIDPNIPR